MTREMGKVLTETRGDVQEAIDTAYYMAGEGRRLFGQTTPSELQNKFAMSVRMPVGVVMVEAALEAFGADVGAVTEDLHSGQLGPKVVELMEDRPDLGGWHSLPKANQNHMSDHRVPPLPSLPPTMLLGEGPVLNARCTLEGFDDAPW